MWVNRAIWFAIAVAMGAGASVTHSAVGVLGSVVWLLGWCVLSAVLLLWVPRIAHSRFLAGEYSTARFWYRILRWVVLHEKSLGGVQVSIAGSFLAENQFVIASELLENIDGSKLSASARAAWLNNRAYLRVRNAQEFASALALCDQAIALRPYVSGFHHTRAVVLIGLGRVEEAIAILDGIWRQYTVDVTNDVFEAERCYDLAIAWAKKGQREYAVDYFERSRRTAPESQWAERAKEFDIELGALPVSSVRNLV